MVVAQAEKRNAIRRMNTLPVICLPPYGRGSSLQAKRLHLSSEKWSLPERLVIAALLVKGSLMTHLDEAYCV